jgi:hypothetical protein
MQRPSIRLLGKRRCGAVARPETKQYWLTILAAVIGPSADLYHQQLYGTRTAIQPSRLSGAISTHYGRLSATALRY